jgi:BolA family transcriptional regulator, general stress-responsive regulator
MNERRVELIRKRLQDAFNPETLEIYDESHLHVGHAGARSGKGHFRVRILARQFAGLPLKKRHQMVYEALDQLMETEIHALSLVADSPKSSANRPN